ncbi:cytochrome P450 [Lentzea atacamensis]|uniref:cytochrome P450 n=1 Tax=Lentzea atacamensis TaxID=531938 RepID=UPI001F381F6C|nr:cytochrome P450 [Lentzea atacamensis]
MRHHGFRVLESADHGAATQTRTTPRGSPTRCCSANRTKPAAEPQPAGDLVLLGIDQAKRDEDRFPDPAAFTPREPNPHLTFGRGPRSCVGAPLARVELTEVFGALVTRFETFVLAVDVAQLTRRAEQLVGEVAELPVRWTAP